MDNVFSAVVLTRIHSCIAALETPCPLWWSFQMNFIALPSTMVGQCDTPIVAIQLFLSLRCCSFGKKQRHGEGNRQYNSKLHLSNYRLRDSMFLCCPGCCVGFDELSLVRSGLSLLYSRSYPRLDSSPSNLPSEQLDRDPAIVTSVPIGLPATYFL